MTGVPAKVLTQTSNNPDELVCFGCPNFINTTKPVSMGQDDYQNFLMWKRENRDYGGARYDAGKVFRVRQGRGALDG